MERTRPDACPGALQVHRAADGGLARVRIPGGWLTAAQWRAIRTAAADLGDGGLELTSRANVQIRGLAPGAEVALGNRLAAAGLLPSATHERVRNIVASPRSGRDAGGLIDVRPWVRALDEGLCADPALAELPGRFLFVLDDGRRDVSGLGADVTAVPLDGKLVAVLLDGADVGLRVAPGAVVATMLEVARWFVAHRGSEWRLGELGTPFGAARPPGPLPEPATRRGSAPSAGSLVDVGVRLGRVTATQAAALDHALEAAGGAPLAVTPWRTLLVDGPVDAAALTAAEFVLDAASPWRGVSACTGRPGCAKSRADVQADAHRVVDDTLPVHWVGCSRHCGRPAGRHVLVEATGEGEYQMSVAG
jgi:precorrin-3B synthase